MTDNEEKGEPSESQGKDEQRGAQAHEAAANTATDPPPVVTNDKQPDRAAGEQPFGQKRENRASIYRFLIGRESIVMVGFNGLLVVIGFFEILLLCNQNTQMVAQTSQMTKQTIEMSRQTASMKSQLNAMLSQNNTMIQQNGITMQQLDAMRQQNADIFAQTLLGAGQLRAMESQNVEISKQVQLTERQLKEAVRSNDIANMTAKNQLRAYLTISETKWEDVGTNVRLTVIIKNSGQTSANEMNVVLKRFFEDLPYDGKFTWEPSKEDLARKYIIGPGRDFQYELDGPTESQRAAIKAKKAAFWLVGIIRYRDIFGEPHCVRFRFIEGKGIEHSPSFGMKYDIGGNSANQDDCE